MNKLLLVLMMFGWAGCTQQEEEKETRYLGVLARERADGSIMFFTGNVPPDDSGITWWIVPPPQRAKFVRDSIVEANTTWEDGIADTTWMGATSFGGQSPARIDTIYINRPLDSATD